jgi:PAS domain S-box-containing protein
VLKKRFATKAATPGRAQRSGTKGKTSVKTGLKAVIHASRPGKRIPPTAAIQDITEGSQMKEEILTDEARLNRSQAIAHLGSWELDIVNDRLAWSDEVYRIFGLQPREFAATYEAFLAAVHPDDRGIVDAAYTGSLREGRDTYEIEHRIIRKSTGEVRYVHEKCEHMRDTAGKIVRSVGMVHDITEQKAAKEHIRSLARFPGENPNPILRVSREGVILYANESCRSLGDERFIQAGQSIPGDWLELVNKAFRVRQKMDADIPMGDKVFMISIVPFPDAGYANLYGRDVTERVRLVEMVEEQRRLAEQSADEARQRADELNATFAAIVDAVIVFDAGAKIQRANPAAERIFGFDPVHMEIDQIRDRLSTRHPDGRPLDPAQAPSARALQGKTVTGERYVITNAEKREVTVMASASPLRVGDRIVGAVAVWHDVTERERLLEEVRLRASELDTVINSIADGVMIHGASGKILRMNPAAEKILGYTAAERNPSVAERTVGVLQTESADGRRFDDPQDLPVSRALRGQTVRNSILKVRPSGADKMAWVSVSAAPIQNPEGAVLGAVSTLTDISELMEMEEELRRARNELESRVGQRTLELKKANAVLEAEILERQHAESALRQANSYNRNLIEASIDPLVTITQNGKIGDVNAATEDVTGRTRQELIGTDFSSYFTDEEQARAGYRRVFSEGKVRDYELEIRHRDGHLTPVLYNATVFTGETGEVMGVFAAARDVTRRKQAEMAARENTRRVEVMAEISHLLVEAGPNYRTVLDRIAQSVALLFGDGCLIHLPSEEGTQLKKVVGYPADSPRSAVAGSPPGIPVGLIHHVYKTKQPLFLPVATPEEIHRISVPDGAPPAGFSGPSSIMVAPLIFQEEALGTLSAARSAPGNPFAPEDLILLRAIADRLALAIVNAHLYSDLKNALAEEQKARQQLIQTEKLAAMGRLLGSVAHELNNPLQSIKNCLYLIQQDVPNDPAVQNYLHMASSETQRLVKLVADLRALYRPYPMKTMQPHNLSAILREVRTLLAPHLQSGNVEWQQSDGPEEYVVQCDKERLQQIFINLATNAIEAMHPAGGTLSVRLILSPDASQVGAVFQDTGPGIPPEMVSKLFEPFVTSKPSGLGLGLSICYDIAQKHGGQITVESPPGKGATFTLWLPLTDRE